MPKISRFSISNRCEECDGELIEGSSSYLCSMCGLEHDSLYLSTKSAENLGQSIKKIGTNIDSTLENNLEKPESNLKDDAQEYTIKKTVKHIPEFGSELPQDNEQIIIEIMRRVFIFLKVPPKVQDRSSLLYNLYKKKIKGRGIEHIVLSAVALYITSYEFKNEFPVTLKEITSAYGIIGRPVKDKNILRIIREYRLKDKLLGSKRSEIYISRICSQIYEKPDILDKILKTYRLDNYTFVRLIQTYSLEILKNIPYSKRGSKQPFPFAVATVFVCETFFSRILDKSPVLTLKSFVECTKVSKVTIRNNSKIIQSCDLSNIITELSKEIRNNLKP